MWYSHDRPSCAACPVLEHVVLLLLLTPLEVVRLEVARMQGKMLFTTAEQFGSRPCENSVIQWVSCWVLLEYRPRE
jgi:hypothetical protein